MANQRDERPPRFDWVTVIAILLGLTILAVVTAESWLWHPLL
jgi:hypothetical protein